MAAEIINLRRARKSKARAERDARAAENRAAFGRAKDEKASTRAIKALEERRHASGRREAGPDDDSDALAARSRL